MRKEAWMIYKKYYDLISAHPGLTLSEYARMTPGGTRYYSNLQKILSQMEYHGFLLIEGESGDLRPFKIIRRYPEDLHNDQVSRDCNWRRLGTTVQNNGRLPMSGYRTGKHTNWWKCATI
jgi:hypothetical protein